MSLKQCSIVLPTIPAPIIPTQINHSLILNIPSSTIFAALLRLEGVPQSIHVFSPTEIIFTFLSDRYCFVTSEIEKLSLF